MKKGGLFLYMNDPSDPLGALVAQFPENTEIDKHLLDYFNQDKPNQPLEDNLDNKSQDEEGPITLKVRQPSFSSLHGELITKAGQNVTDLPEVKEEEDPVIVLDQGNENIPASISYHPSSYSSIGNHHLDMGKDLQNIEPPKTIPIEEVPDQAEENGQQGELMEEEEEEFQEVQIVKELKNKNEERWKRMGFKPPDNLIELAREASRSKLHTFNSIPTNQTPSFEGIEEEPSSPQQQSQLSPQQTSPTNNEDYTYVNNEQKSTIRPKHRRCGSNGMKLGEASTSLVKMSQALMIPEKTDQNEIPETINEADEFIEEELEYEDNGEEEYVNEEEEDEFELEAEQPYSYNQNKDANNDVVDRESNADKEIYVEEKNDLYGRLSFIVREPQTSTVYKVILKNSSEGVPRSEQSNVRQALKKILNQCIDNIWIDESEYISRLIDLLGKVASPKKSSKKQNKDMNQIQNVKDRYKKAQQKYSDLIDSENIKHKNAIDQLMREYHREASELDKKYQSDEMINKYSKPSPQLLAMRENIKNLLRSNQIEQARTENVSVSEQEAKEIKENSRKLREKYFAADRDLKEQFAGKREILNMKHKLEIQRLESSKSRSKKKYDKLIAHAKEQKSQNRDIDVSNVDVENAAPLLLKPFKPLNRNRDDKLIELMATEIENGKDIGKVDIDALFRNSSKSRSTSKTNTPRSKTMK